LPIENMLENTHIIYVGKNYIKDNSGNWTSLNQVWEVSVKDGERKLVINEIPPSVIGLAFLEDAYQFILISDDSIWLSNLDGVRLKEYDNSENFINDFPPYSPIWNLLSNVGQSPQVSLLQDGQLPSPDGEKIAIWKKGNSDLIIFDKLTGQNNPIMKTGTDTQILGNWSPDGKFFAYSFRDDTTSQAQIFIVDADGQNLTPLTTLLDNAEVERPHWSPDGKKLAFVRHGILTSYVDVLDVAYRENKSTEIYPYQGHSVMDQGELVWSPDSNWIAILMQEPGGVNRVRYDIHALNVSTREVYCVTQDESVEEIMMDWR